ncbi:MAG: UbiD family decarboxylase, partial [Acidimicrobiaceae bacterium]|nr:UbiD family decarboxylase [Acidimicrobiaceae bacterium]
LELGAIAEINYKIPNANALLFDNIQGYGNGFRVLTGSTTSPGRLGRTLNLGDSLNDLELVAAIRNKPSKWAADSHKFQFKEVQTAPFFENRYDRDHIDLLSFPVPRWHQHDGGRYIGTGCFVVTSDPETGEYNGGSYRMEVQDHGGSVTLASVPGKHGSQHIDRWFQREGRAPVAVSFGHDPLLIVVGGTEVPSGIFELDYAGAILGKNIPVVSGPVTGLPIPAGAEIVIEGWLSPDNTRDEGPFGEWTGYYSGERRPCLAIEIEALYCRNNPILLGAPPSKPPHDYSYMRTMLKSAMIQDELSEMGVAGVKAAWAHEAGGGRLFIAVSIDQRFAGHARQVGLLASQCPAAAYMNRFVVVVDDDIDPSDLGQVVWAMSTRCDPATDFEIIHRTWGSKLDPMLAPGLPPYNNRVVIDACRPFERKATFPRVAESAPDYLAEVQNKWAHVFKSGD